MLWTPKISCRFHASFLNVCFAGVPKTVDIMIQSVSQSGSATIDLIRAEPDWQETQTKLRGSPRLSFAVKYM